MTDRPHLSLVTADELPGPHRVVAFRGALDVATAETFKTALAQQADEPITDLIVDLRGVTFADSTALSILLNATRRRVTAGRFLVTVCSPGPVLRLMELSALTQTLNVVDSIAAAHAKIASSEAGPFRPAGS
ncbi:hypothetical protein DSM112329_01154 [Paraconexibacter sp. AEG42_29]|uniref:STAS domain-containing protein n=1 Tax=Paraconexibacter sp. AEG42_29 TaxID=2997339 RepID=A0AAU7ARQ6_9ACTN